METDLQPLYKRIVDAYIANLKLCPPADFDKFEAAVQRLYAGIKAPPARILVRVTTPKLCDHLGPVLEYLSDTYPTVSYRGDRIWDNASECIQEVYQISAQQAEEHLADPAIFAFAATDERDSFDWGCLAIDEICQADLASRGNVECGVTKDTCLATIDTHSSVGAWYPGSNAITASEKPSAVHISRKGSGRYRWHNRQGPAIEYPSGLAEYIIDGVRVLERTVLSPDSIMAEDIQDEPSPDIQRVLKLQFGPGIPGLRDDDYDGTELYLLACNHLSGEVDGEN